MYLLEKRFWPFVFSVAMLFLAFGTALAQDVAVTVSLTQDFDKKPVAVNDTTQAKVKATANPVTPPYCILDPSSSWTWTWEVVSSPPNATVVITPDAGDTSQATVTASYSDSGDYPIFIKASVAIGNSCGPPLTGSGYCGLFVTAVKVKAIQYSVNGSPFQDVPSPFYALQGKSVTFKALPSPDGASWPANYPVWGGTSGASGTGESTTVTFNTLSPTANDYWTVQATCGNTETANVVVFDLVPILTPQDNFEGRDLDAYGVCEFIDLSFDTVPSGISEYQIGGLKWVILSGGGDLLEGMGGVDTYQCPDVAANVTLALEIVGGPFLAQKKEALPKEIVPPDGAKIFRRPDTALWHLVNTCSAGFCGDYYATCKKIVSFKKIEVREGGGLSKATGYWKEGGLDGLPHTTSAWIQLKDFVKDKGYQWNMDGEKRKYDKIATGGGGPPYAGGDYSWPIENQYRKKGDGDAKTYAIAIHEATALVTGTCLIQKANSGFFEALAAALTSIPANWND